MSGLSKNGIPGGILLTLVSLLFCVSSFTLEAQTPSPPVNPETVNWKTGEDATVLLLDQIEVFNQQLPGMPEGTPMYNNTLRRIAYYKAIVVEMDRGSSIVQSLKLAIPAAATLGFSKEASFTSKIALRALHTETRILLTN